MVARVLFASSAASATAFTWFNATTTRFDVEDYSVQMGSCGGCGLNMFANVEGWAAISAAESMQTPYACDGDYNCATGSDQTTAGGVSAGCGQCYSVHSQGYNPYEAEIPKVNFYAAVVDTCAHKYNKDWCPKHVGVKNQFGFEYHLNVLGADVDKLKLGDNPVVHFRPIDCPDDVLKVMQSSCCDQLGKGIGCSSICPDDQCSGAGPSPGPAMCDPACKGDRSCVVQEDGYWAQCIDCTKKVFQKECTYWGEKLKDAAEKFCESKCAGTTVV
jgi:hypothetical protein